MENTTMASDPKVVKHSSSSLRVEQSGWVNQIRELLERDDLEIVIEYPASIFKLPDYIRDANPDALVPRRIALGPHHHLRLQLYNMQPYKLHMAQKAKEEFQLEDFHQLQNRIAPLELRIRACYADHLSIDGESLTWMMLLDALFLLRVLQNFSDSHRYCFLSLLKFDDENLFDSLDVKLAARFQIVSDVLKLENQIPFLVFREILSNIPRSKLPLFLYNFSLSVFPFESVSSHLDSEIPAIFDRSRHLLHFLYLLILTLPVKPSPPEILENSSNICSVLESKSTLEYEVDFTQLLSESIGSIHEMVDPVVMIVKNEYSSSANHITPPSVIPSASQLKKLHVKFNCVPSACGARNEGILDTEFKIIHGSPPTLSLPIFRIRDFTETVLENLVAFEAMANINPPVLARYLEFMQALVPTPVDVKILREAEILKSCIDMSDEEVAKFFKRVGSYSISTLNVKKPSHLSTNHMDPEPNNEDVHKDIKDKYEKGLKRVIEDINHYYGSFWRVKAKRIVKKYVSVVLVILLICLFIGFTVLSILGWFIAFVIQPIFDN